MIKVGQLRLTESPFTACCDECGKEYSYEPVDVLRFEFELPALFEPHRLFK